MGAQSFTMTKSICLLLFLPFFANADLKVICEARETRLLPGCVATSYKNRFEAKYQPNGVAVSSYYSHLDSEVSFNVGAVKSLKNLSARISRSNGSGFINFSRASRPAELQDDWVYVSYSEGRSKDPGDCDDKIFEMVCILVDDSSTFAPTLSSNFDTKFGASK